MDPILHAARKGGTLPAASSRDARLLPVGSSARLRASRRLRARAREHARGVRPRDGARRRRPRARRPPVARRRRRRASRPAARPDDEPRRGSWPTAPRTSWRASMPAGISGEDMTFRSAARRSACRRSRRCWRATPDVRIVIELKVNRPELARAVARSRAPRPGRSTASVSARSASACCAPPARSSRRSPRAPRAKKCGGRSIAPGGRWPLWRVPYDGFQVPEVSGRTRVVSPRFVDAAHRAGLGVQVWTVDTEEDARRLLDWGVDALITDRPDIIVPVRDAVCAHRR